MAGARRPLRVVLERRPNAAARQFLELDELVGECNRESSLSATAAEERGEDADVFSVGDATDGRHSSHVECMAHTFGKSLVEDMLLMRSADVLVAPHGAGQMNAIFLPSLAALLESTWLAARMLAEPFEWPMAGTPRSRTTATAGTGDKMRQVTSGTVWSFPTSASSDQVTSRRLASIPACRIQQESIPACRIPQESTMSASPAVPPQQGQVLPMGLLVLVSRREQQPQSRRL